MKRVVVVGGGIAGLSAAFHLDKLSQERGLPVDTLLIESSGRLGGKILTERRDGLVLEGGPDSFITVKPEALELARELGLGPRLLPTNRDAADVFIYARGRMRRMPEGLLLMAPARIWPFLRSDLVTWRGKLRMALEWLLPRGGAGQDESMGAFTRRRLGGEALEVLVQPIMAGIYGGDADALSLQSTFPRFSRLEREYGSVLKGLRAAAGKSPRPGGAVTTFMSLAGGLEEFVEALAARLKPRARLNARAASVRPEGRGFRVDLEGGESLPSDAVILTPLAWQAAELVGGMDPELAAALREIPCTSTATVSLAYDESEVPELPRGMGFAVPRTRGGCVSAGTFTHQKFPGRVPPGTALIRCFVGGSGREEALEADDPALVAAVKDDLRRLWSVRAEPRLARVFRWPRANPQYTVGHEGRLQRIEARLALRPGLRLAGASYRGVGIPDCIASGADAARRAIEGLK